jgi:hypothetical protein
MKALWMLPMVGLCWLVALANQTSFMPHFLLDAILPPRILDLTTPEEEMRIIASLGKTFLPSYLSWIGACAVCGLSAYGLWASRRAEGKANS